MDKHAHLRRGEGAEQLASRYLSRRGLQLIQRNYRCRSGELDLIMHDGRSLVFVEVRYRADSRYGSAADTVDWRKRRRLIAAAQHYLQHANHGDPPCRFDVVAVGGPPEARRIHWIVDAFQA
jgi:putative endonuclease